MLKTEYKYIRFEQELKTWVCKNKRHDSFLGSIVYLKEWRQFVFQPPSGTEFSADCLRDIADFLEQLNKERKKP